MTSNLSPRIVFSFSVALGFGLILIIAGCNSTESDSPDAAETPADVDSGNDRSDHDHGDHDHGSADHSGKTDMEKMNEALADLPEEDRQSAMKQHFCPVTGEMLGSMGVPEKVDVDGKTVWICCDGCKDKLLAEPDKYLAELDD